MLSETAAMFLPEIKCKSVVVYLYIGLIVTYDFAYPVLAWKQTWTPNSIVRNDEVIDVPRFEGEENDTDYFKVLLQEGNHMLVGAKNKMYNISLLTLQEDVERTLEWKPKKSDTEICMKKDNSKDKCQNYIQVLGKYNGSYYVCGTNAFEPKCRLYQYNTDTQPKPQYEPTEETSGIGRCPYDPDHNSTAIYREGKLYSGTVADLQAKDPLIMQSERRIRTEQHDSNMLNEPNFVNSLEIDDKIYFFFRETAVETIRCRQATFSRVARVCKRDLGGKFDDNWTSFFKARLACSIPGDLPFDFDEIASTTELLKGFYMPTINPGDRTRMFYAVFNTPENSIWGSAVCAYTYDDVVKAFNGRFKGQETAHHKWKQISDDKTPDPHPSACPDDSKRLPDKTIEFVRSYPLMDSTIDSVGGAPLLVLTNQQSRFTAIAVDSQKFSADGHFYDVMFVGMADGRVLKAINNGSDGKINSVVIEDIQVLAKDEPVKELKIFYKSGEGKLIVVSKKNIVSIPLHRCEKQKTCGDCLALQDPYCAWQNDGTCRGLATGLYKIQECPDGGRRTEKVTTTTTTTEAPVKTCPTCNCDCSKSNQTDIILGETSKVEGTQQNTTDGDETETLVQPPASQSCAPEYIPGDQIYTASTLAIAIVVSIVVALLAGFLIGYRVSLCRNHTRNTEEMINYEQNFGSLRKHSNRHSLEGSHNLYTDPTFHDKLKIQKNILVSNNIPQKSPNLPNGSIESKTVTPQQAKTYI